MKKNYGPINPKAPKILHGGDYNPEQWRETKEIWDEDMRIMKKSGCSVMTVGVFSWVTYEPEEGVFDFTFLDEIMDRLAANGMYAVLATPSGARPAWMSQKYPEVLRVGPERVRILHGQRHNHCWTSPVYREKVNLINSKLAERYKNHPALLVWHISNELAGDCHCELCQEKFREWLKVKYNNDLNELNRQWWTTFWSHTYTDWSQIESPAERGENSVHGLFLDWRRFTTDNCLDFIRNEIEPLRKFTPTTPITTNFMGTDQRLDYWKISEILDVISWDNYPLWHCGLDVELAAENGFMHDMERSFKHGKPFMLMESTPTYTNWHPNNKLKRPGFNLLTAIQTVAHGGDTVQYFQWRQCRGSVEKFHGAILDQSGRDDTRVVKEITAISDMLSKLNDVVGTSVDAEVALMYDWQNSWALTTTRAFSLAEKDKGYLNTTIRHYTAFWQHGVPVDIVNQDQDFSKYKILVAPMMYMVRPGVAEKIDAFVKNGGIFITTYISGMVNENDLCYLGGFPGPLRPITGIWAEEVDTLYPDDRNTAILQAKIPGMKAEYEAKTYCEVLHCETAKPLAVFGSDFYKGMPAVTENQYGNGTAYYIAFCDDGAFEADFYQHLVEKHEVKKALDTKLPYGVTAQTRCDEKNTFVFIQNYTQDEKTVTLDGTYQDVLSGETLSGEIKLAAYGACVLRK